MTQDEFASAFPVGTPIRYYPFLGNNSCAIDSEIASEPWALASGHVVVKIAGKSGGMSIRHIMKRDWTMTDSAPETMLQFFAYEHLPEKLQAISKPFGEMAKWMVETLPRNPERTAGLRKLLEAKDCAVRANLGKF